jgi:hypothetical protein
VEPPRLTAELAACGRTDLALSQLALALVPPLVPSAQTVLAVALRDTPAPLDNAAASTDGVELQKLIVERAVSQFSASALRFVVKSCP